MEIIKPISFPNVEKPIVFGKLILDELGNNVRNLIITDDCDLYDKDDWNNSDFINDCKLSDIRINIDSHGRKYAAVNTDSNNHKRTQHLARVAKISFDEPRKSVDFYKTHQIDHINPSIPLDNNVLNLEWVTPQENMYRAGKSRVMEKVYDPKTIHKICQMLVENKSRKEIVETLGINKNLVYDIKTGTSHRSISEQYLDKGFKYHIPADKEEKDKIAEKICKLIVAGLSDKEIVSILGEDRRKVSGIRTGFIYKHISKKYGII